MGGVPGGVIGGVIGGTGDGPVLDYDQPPRPIKMDKPEYPQEAFVKKIEGTVEVEILIDANGNVARARVIQSIPALDQAALKTVYRWRFSPAIKNGRPVARITPMVEFDRQKARRAAAELKAFRDAQGPAVSEEESQV